MSQNPKPPTASQLLLRAQARDGAAFATFVLLFTGYIRAVALRSIGGDKRLSPEDVVQQTLLNIVEWLDTFEPRPNEPNGLAWISKITRGVVWKQRQAANKWPSLAGDAIEAAPRAGPGLDTDAIDAREIVAELMKRLMPREARVIELRYVNELSFAEIGELLNETTENARKIHERALKKLRNEPGAPPGEQS